MAFDMNAFLRRYGTNPKTTVQLTRHGSVQLDGRPDGDDAASVAQFLAKQQPTPKVLAMLADLAASQPYPDVVLQSMTKILGQQTPTKELLKSLADLVAEDNPHIAADLVDGKPATKSTLNILATLAARQTPSKPLLRAIAEIIANLPPTRQMLQALADIVHATAPPAAE
jgi:hypothetical protein